MNGPCELGCVPHDVPGGCPNGCPCDCHREFQIDTYQANGLAPLPRPGEVIKSPHAELAIDKVAPEHRAAIQDPTKVFVGVRLPDPFTGVEMPPEVDMVNHPPHYSSHPSGVECIVITRHMTFDGGNAFKYVYRAEAKNGAQDFDKARWYLEDALQHADPLWLPNTYLKVRGPLQMVVEFEPNPKKVDFFKACAMVDRTGALEAVRNLLASS